MTGDPYYTMPGLPSDLMSRVEPGRREIKAAIHVASGSPVADDPHTRIHQGAMFTASYRTADLDNAANLDLILTTPADDWPHLIAKPAIGGGADFSFYEAPAFTGGTAVAAHNNNRNSARTYGGAIVHTPTVTEPGSPLLLGVYLPGGTGGQATGSAGVGFEAEWVLKASTSYLIRLTNRSGQSRRASIALMFYSAPLIGGSA